MLEQMRKGSQHIVVKGLFFLLALTFAVWGVGDVLRNNSSAGYVATVGKVGISPAELDNIVRGEVARYQQATGKTLSEEDVEKFGIKKYALSQLIQNKVTTTRANELGLVAGKKAIAKNIYENDIFFNEEGKFDKERFKTILHENGFTEEKFINTINRDVAVKNLLETMTIASVSSNIIAREIFSFDNESRIADLITLPANSATETPEPAEADLVKFYQDHQDNFTVNELRAVTYITFNIDKIKNSIKLSSEELLSEYQKSMQQYKTEETRNVDQYLFTKEEEAKAAYEKITKGDIKGLLSSQIALGNITKSSVPAEVKDLIFSLKQGETSQPIKSALGWHIFIVKSIEGEKVKRFDEVKPDIEKEMLASKASDEFSKFGSQVEDEFAAGKTMDDVAQKFDLIIHKVSAIDSNGNGLNGGKVTDLPDQAVLLPLAFNLDVGGHSALTLLSDNASYAVLRVDAITPKKIKTLDEVKATVTKMWKETEKEKLLKEKATELAGKINAGEDLQSLITKTKLKISKSQTIKRPSADSVFDGKNGEPILLVRELFTLKKEGSITAPYRNAAGDFVIAKLRNVIKVSPDNNKNAYTETLSKLTDEMRGDIQAQYINYLQNIYPVSIKNIATTEK